MRPLFAFGTSLALALVVGCSSGDYTLERRGGPYPSSPIVDPPLEGGAGSDAGSGGAGGLIPFCDALSVTRAKCQRCHDNPTQNGAPVPFVTFEDFHVQYGMSELKWFERAAQVVEIDYMPYVDLNKPPTSIMPPVEPLTADEKATLLTWFAQGALPEGGTDCPE